MKKYIYPNPEGSREPITIEEMAGMRKTELDLSRCSRKDIMKEKPDGKSPGANGGSVQRTVGTNKTQ